MGYVALGSIQLRLSTSEPRHQPRNVHEGFLLFFAFINARLLRPMRSTSLFCIVIRSGFSIIIEYAILEVGLGVTEYLRPSCFSLPFIGFFRLRRTTMDHPSGWPPKHWRTIPSQFEVRSLCLQRHKPSIYLVCKTHVTFQVNLF